MTMRDLSKDDDFLSHLLVEKLGTGAVPLLVHKMDPSRKLPKTDAQQLLQIVRRLVTSKLPVQHATRQAVDDLLKLSPIRYYLQNYQQKQINAFATHASRYFELYHPSGCIEIAHTSRYSHRTGKSELCILATRPLTPGSVITELKGSMANLSEEEDKELKRTDIKNIDIRRDFSVIHSKQMKKNHLFLGPARFVNHDCDNNCELFREGKYITFRVMRPIAVGEEITAHYGDGYFGRKNRHCLCETCEKRGRGGYAPDHRDSDAGSGSESGSGSDSDDAGSSSDSDSANKRPQIPLNINERRTRRGVYATVQVEDDSSDESEDDAESSEPVVQSKVEEVTPEIEGHPLLSPLNSSRSCSSVTHAAVLMTPDPDTLPHPRSSPLTSVSSSPIHDSITGGKGSKQSTPTFRSIISTRRQKAAAAISGTPQAGTRPASEDSVSVAGKSSTPHGRRSASSSRASVSTNPRSSKGKEKASTPSVLDSKGKEPKIKKEENESRILRARPSVASVVPVEVTPKKPEIIYGSDGKPLPMCGTCNNVLPLISVDHKIIWGLEETSSSRKKKEKRDCPRCLRHFAIYGQPWPHRVPVPGSGNHPTPREEPAPPELPAARHTTKPSTAIDKKIVAAATSVKVGQRRRREQEGEESPTKRRKLETSKVSVGMSAKAKKEFMKSKLASKGTPKILKFYGRSRANNKPTTSSPDAPKRKRGRPRLTSPIARKRSKSTSAKDSGFDQPRESNGRFGRKDESAKKTAKRNKPTAPAGRRFSSDGKTLSTRAERALERGKVRSWLDQEAASLKRASEVPSDDSPRKRKFHDEDVEMEVVSTSKDSEEREQSNTTPSFRGGLLGRPTPYTMARRPVWQDEHSTEEETSSSDEAGPFTPDETRTPPAVTVEGTDIEISAKLAPPSAPRSFGAFKPSPYMFAKRRWASNPTTMEVDSIHLSSTEHDSATTSPGEPMSISAAIKRNEDDVSDVEYISGSEAAISIMSTPSTLTSVDNAPELLEFVRRWSSPGPSRLTAFSVSDDDKPMPICDDDSDLSSDEPEQESIMSSPKQLRDIFPSTSGRSASGYVPKSSLSFTSGIVATPPNFINAGWDTSSDASD